MTSFINFSYMVHSLLSDEVASDGRSNTVPSLLLDFVFEITVILDHACSIFYLNIKDIKRSESEQCTT